MQNKPPSVILGIMKQKMSARINRREFLRRAAVAAAAPMIIPGSVLGLNGAVAPSNRVVFGVIGPGNRARFIMPCFLAFQEIRFVAASDCREDRLRSAKEMIDTHYSNKDCRTYTDFRELLAQKDIDAVLIATGDRWHATASALAARAGKDIYCEKPITLNIAEGRSLVETCRRFGCIYQAGTQRRSTASYRFAVDMVHQGKIGRLRTVEIQVWEDRPIPHDKAIPVPKGWDYDMWLGPVQWRPFVPARVNGWNYFWDTGAGSITGMGTHYVDQMQWVLNRDHTGPVEFETQVEFPDPVKYMSETSIRGVAKCRYADGIECIMYQRKGFVDRYIRYIGDEGWIQVDDQTDEVTAEPKSILSSRTTGGVSWAKAGDHIRNLLDSIRSRTPTICHPEAAHRAQTICEAMDISMRIGRKLKWDPVKERFDSEEANRMMFREPRAPWRI
ncbi:MAG: Gfo/Idh/MocA family oxidoreductase [Kiritimatiellae bacterium]|nr:Gfo/Idh/MocA family oxidoreductase [Kiritimatiellia bacterium]MDD5519394.1 Gfo/Idh/MocA family oxidoreductase [Kiritimatiellia bacterium]